jgi:DNA ligase (NAD+)
MHTPESQASWMDKTMLLLKKEDTLTDIALLRDVLHFHERKYYIEDNPLISDFEYDQLYQKLVRLEEKYPDQISPDSPTQRVSSDLSGDFVPVQHLVPMLSLDNSYNEEDLSNFDLSVKKLCGLPPEFRVDYCVEPKFDGGSIALVYENDILVRAATRGNGQMGEEMTPNAKTLPSIPLRARFSAYGISRAELRGEALIRKEVFEKINAEREKEGLTLFANPRNAATGGLRTKDPNETRKRGLEAFVYQLAFAQTADGQNFLPTLNTHYAGIELLGNLGFKIPRQEKTLCRGIEEVHDFVRKWEEARDAYGYEIDGMVVKVNDLRQQEKCGYTAHHPRWAIAFKFKAKQATSTLLAVEYQVGKIGSITPVAKIDTVHLAGVNVSSISLHNEEFIRSKDLRLHDKVLIERAGDVIPYIVKSFPELRSGYEKEIQFPEYCPINTTTRQVKLIREEGEAAWRCPDCVCGAQNLQKMIFHISKDAMDIDGFGKANIERFYNLGWIRDISDIYRLDYSQMAQLEGFGKKSAENIKAAVEKAKKNSIHRLLHSLSIHHLGKKASKLIAEHVNHVLDLVHWTTDKYLDIKDIGPVVAENMQTWFSNQSNIDLLLRMERYGVNLIQTEEDKPMEVASDGKLVGKTILFTGTLQQMGRKEAEEKAAKSGARIISAVSAQLDILVVGEKAGSKLKKARDLGNVQILTEEEFLQLIQG